MARKKREEDEVVRLQKEIRELKAVNRSLMKRLKKVDRDATEEIEKALRAIEEDYARSPDTGPVPCEHCGKGHIVDIEIVGRKFQRCNSCDWKSGRKVS